MEAKSKHASHGQRLKDAKESSVFKGKDESPQSNCFCYTLSFTACYNCELLYCNSLQVLVGFSKMRKHIVFFSNMRACTGSQKPRVQRSSSVLLAARQLAWLMLKES
jgi:hypothetical protein